MFRRNMKPHVDIYRVRSCECAPDGTLRLPRLLDYLQETAADHARELGFDFPVVDEATGARAAWVLAQLRVRLDEAPRWRDEVTVDTFPYGVRALAASRDFVIGRAGGGAPYGVATSRWMLIDPVARKAVRVPSFIGDASYDREPVFGPGDPFTRLRWPADAPSLRFAHSATFSGSPFAVPNSTAAPLSFRAPERSSLAEAE